MAVDEFVGRRLAQDVGGTEDESSDPERKDSAASGEPRRGQAGHESTIPEPLRRLLEAGLGRWGERPEALRQRLADLKLPREAWSAILAQLDDRKSGLYRLIAKEVRDLLQSTNFAEELVKALTTLSFEMKTEVRFIPNDAGGAKPNIRSAVKVKPTGSDEKKEDAPSASQTDAEAQRAQRDVHEERTSPTDPVPPKPSPSPEDNFAPDETSAEGTDDDVAETHGTATRASPRQP